MFFTQINQLMNQGIDITLVIRKKEGQLTVSTLPKSNRLKDEAQNHIIPLTITGTPEKLDMGYLQAICQPIQKATGLIINMSQFEEQAEKATANSKAAKELKDKAAKEEKEKKDKFDKLMKKAEELEKEQKLSEALTNLQQARTVATSQAIKSVDDKITAIKFKLRQGSLFDEKPEVQQVQQQQNIPVNQPQPFVQPQPVAQQPIQQQPVNGYSMQNGNVPAQPTPQQPVQLPLQQPVQKTMNGNGQYMQYSSAINGQQSYNQPQVQPQNNNGVTFHRQPAIDFEVDPEPQPLFTTDYSAHREGEYDQYPDFPGYSNNMSNHQNM